MSWASRLRQLDPQVGAAAAACTAALAGTFFFWQTAPPLAECKGRCRVADLEVGDLLALRGPGSGFCHRHEHWVVYLGTGADLNRLLGKSAPADLDAKTHYVGHRHFPEVGGRPSIRIDPLRALMKAVSQPLHRVEVPGFQCRPDKADIAAKVLSRQGEAAWDLQTKNCQHFATWARYGRPYTLEGTPQSAVETFRYAVLMSLGLGIGIGWALFGGTPAAGTCGAIGWVMGAWNPLVQRREALTLQRWQVEPSG
eukprot:GGOE01000712.1.p1 GENE.GGOE01000712.1~~GGOE01000712.1.p1  ORF type:complete len:254 (-),score=45.84 GGOE01000712.1:301-1062(-)